MLEVRAPASGAVLGTVAPVDLAEAAHAGRVAQPLWSLVPIASRARYIRRTAVAMLDELDDLALRLADETGWPKSHIVLSELLPAVRRAARAGRRRAARARRPAARARAPRCSPGAARGSCSRPWA